MFADWVRELNFNTLSKSKLEFYRIDSEWHIKWLRDQAYVGTKAYQGIAYFWGCRYKHSLRDCTNTTRRLVHDKFLNEGLELHGETRKHDVIMDYVFDHDYAIHPY
jgi:hypothetical protein